MIATRTPDTQEVRGSDSLRRARFENKMWTALSGAIQTLASAVSKMNSAPPKIEIPPAEVSVEAPQVKVEAPQVTVNNQSPRKWVFTIKRAGNQITEITAQADK